MDITSLTSQQQQAITSRTPEGQTPQEYLDAHTLALVNGWVSADQDAYVRALYDRIRAATPEVQTAIFQHAESQLA